MMTVEGRETHCRIVTNFMIRTKIEPKLQISIDITVLLINWPMSAYMRTAEGDDTRSGVATYVNPWQIMQQHVPSKPPHKLWNLSLQPDSALFNAASDHLNSVSLDTSTLSSSLLRLIFLLVRDFCAPKPQTTSKGRRWMFLKARREN